MAEEIKNIPIEERKITSDWKDEDLVTLSLGWMNEASSFHDELKKVQDLNEQYYRGNQTARNMIPSHKCNAVENRIFEAVETLIPIISANTPQFVVLPAQNNEVSEKKANSVQEILKLQYDSRNVTFRAKLAMAVRHMMIYRLGVLKPYWDEYIDDVNIKFVRPQRIFIPKYGKNVDEIPFIIEKIDMTYDEIESVFGVEVLEKVKNDGGSDNQEDILPAKTVVVWECWTNDITFWRYGNVILRKMANPYFDFTGRKESTTDILGNSVEEDIYYNHFRRPQKPYIFLSAFRLGNSVVGDTDLIIQSIPLQDIINTTNRQIVNNANKMGNSAWLIDPEVMTEEEARTKITNEEGLIIYGSGVANQNLFRRDAPVPLPNFIVDAKVQAENAFDNIFGTHATTRGERREPETLGGRMMLKQADIGRGGTFVDEIDNAVADAGNWFVQLMKLFYESERTVKIYGKDGLVFMKFSRENMEDGIDIVVKAGSTLQVDEVSKRQEALILWQNGALDPITLFERLKFPNPQESAQRLIQWKMGQLLPQQNGMPPDAKPGQGFIGNISPQQEQQEAQNSIGTPSGVQ